MTEDEMVGWRHRLNRREFEQAPGDGEGQRSLACCSPWGHKELDTTEQQQIAQSEEGKTRLVYLFCYNTHKKVQILLGDAHFLKYIVNKGNF